MLRAITSICLIFVAFEVAFSQDWRGIVPLHSNCGDVQRALGITECRNTTYDLKDASVSIAFSDGTCLSKWKVPAGTVLSLDVRTKPALRLVDLHLDERKYKRIVDQQDPNITYLKNYHDGLSIVVLSDGMVSYVSYGPSAKDDYLRCSEEPADQEQPIRDVGFLKFDEYGAISSREEHERLEAFAIQLRAQLTTNGYIIAYGGRRSWIGEAKDRAACVKDYLIKKQGMDSRRLVTVDGGYKEKAVIELYVVVKTSDPPFTSPTVDPRAVQIIKKTRANDQHGACGPPNN